MPNAAAVFSLVQFATIPDIHLGFEFQALGQQKLQHLCCNNLLDGTEEKKIIAVRMHGFYSPR